MFFTCEYCGDRFVRQTNLDKHFCESKKKHLLMKTKIGQTAFYFYKEWRKILGFSTATQKTFCDSKYFKSFINFIEFCNEKMIPDKIGYIELMIDKQVLPSHWCNNLYYEHYIENFDKLYTPIKQVQISLGYMERLASSLDDDMHTVIYQMQPAELMKLVVTKQLSPWLLLFMKSFHEYIKYYIDAEGRILINTVINSIEWGNKIKNNTKSAEKIKQLLSSLNM